jgi:CRP-like cAMP-binding protein
MISSLRDFLNHHVGITDDEFGFLLTKLEHCSFQKREVLIDIGGIENFIYFIEKGLVRRFFYKGNDEIVAHIIKEGGVISSSASFFSRQPSRYKLETLEPTTAYRLSHENREELFSLGNKWEKLGRVITAAYLIQQEQLIYDTTCLTVRQRFVKFMKENPDLILRVPQKQLASYLNIKQETFSRLKHLMTQKQPQH